jgi:hypothetical protein
MDATDPTNVDCSFVSEMSNEGKTQYWQTQRSLSIVSALTKPYCEGCELLAVEIMINPASYNAYSCSPLPA